MKRTGELKALTAAVVSSKVRARAAETEHHRLAAAVDAIAGAIASALADDDLTLASKLRAERAEAELAYVESHDAVAGAALASERAVQQRDLYAREHADGLVDELRPGAHAAAEAVDAAIAQLGEARSAWQAVESEVMNTLRLAGRSTADVGRFPSVVDDLLRDLRRSSVVVPPPLPGPPLPSPPLPIPPVASVKRAVGRLVDVARPAA